MNLFAQAFAWIFDGDHWITQRNGFNILQRIGETLGISLVAVVVIVIIAVPLGFYIGHTGRGRVVGVVSTNIARAIPTLGLLALFLLLLPGNIGPLLIVLVVLGIPPMLAGAYAGVEAVDKQTVDAARAMGMTEWQIISRVEWPLAAPLVIGGLRATALQVISTVTVAAFFAQFGVGYFIVQGTVTVNQPDHGYVEMIAGAILIVAVVLVVDALLSFAQRAAAPKGIARARTQRPRTEANRSGATAGTPIQEGT